MNKTIDDYLTLPYTIEIIPDDGAWFADIKELPGCMTEDRRMGRDSARD